MKIHLGCWKRNIPGWINVDLCNLPYIHYKRSIDDLSCFEDGCADVVYSSYTLEYFDRQEVQDVLVEWRRVSKMGGLLRIAVPDLKATYALSGETRHQFIIRAFVWSHEDRWCRRKRNLVP